MLIVCRVLINNELLFKMKGEEKKFPQSLWIKVGAGAAGVFDDIEHFPKFRSQPEIARAGRPRH